MIIKLFRISDEKLYKFYRKEALRQYIIQNTNRYPSTKATVIQLISMLPKEDYVRIK